MTSTAERIAAYGALNGLGFHGDPEVKAKLLRSVGRAIDRGDWDRVLKLTLAYGAGNAVGSAFRPTVQKLSEQTDPWLVRWG